jgi:hypothetical protein
LIAGDQQRECFFPVTSAQAFLLIDHDIFEE